MGLPQSRLELPVECSLTADQRIGLLSRFAMGHAELTGGAPRSLDEVGKPVLTRREWNGRDDPAYIERGERVASALASLNLVPDSPPQPTYTLSGHREAVQYISTCVSISLIAEGVSSSDIFAGDTDVHPDIGIYTQLRTAVEQPLPTADLPVAS